MGSGLNEVIYHECLERELKSLDIPAAHEPKIELAYKGEKLSHYLVPDFVAYSKIIIELKALPRVDDIHRAQVQNYLRATGYTLGLLVNFGHYPKIEWERIVLEEKHPNIDKAPPYLQQ